MTVSTPGTLKLCSVVQCPASNLWITGLWEQQDYAQERRQPEEEQFVKSYGATAGGWYTIDEDDHNWWKN